MIVAGFGFRKVATVASFSDAFDKAARGTTVDGLATVADKADHPAFCTFAAQMGLPIHRVSPDLLLHQNPITNSEISKKTRGTGSVSEAAAQAAAGPQARLLGLRVISEDRLATCALASGDET